jgi:hypothetical protein
MESHRKETEKAKAKEKEKEKEKQKDKKKRWMSTMLSFLVIPGHV